MDKVTWKFRPVEERYTFLIILLLYQGKNEINFRTILFRKCFENEFYLFFFHFRETTCSVAKNFEAHIFYHEDFNEVQLILQSLGQGFQRTHYAV